MKRQWFSRSAGLLNREASRVTGHVSSLSRQCKSATRPHSERVVLNIVDNEKRLLVLEAFSQLEAERKYARASLLPSSSSKAMEREQPLRTMTRPPLRHAVLFDAAVCQRLSAETASVAGGWEKKSKTAQSGVTWPVCATWPQHTSVHGGCGCQRHNAALCSVQQLMMALAMASRSAEGASTTAGGCSRTTLRDDNMKHVSKTR